MVYREDLYDCFPADVDTLDFPPFAYWPGADSWMEVLDACLVVCTAADDRLQGLRINILTEKIMSNFNEYIKGYYQGVKSLLIGMRTSMKVFLSEESDRTVSGKPPYHPSHCRASSCHAGDASWWRRKQPVYCLRSVPDGLSERNHSSDHRDAGNRGRQEKEVFGEIWI